MRLRCRDCIAVLAIAASLVGQAACQREERRFESSASAPPAPMVALTALVPGTPAPPPESANPYGANAYGISQGKTLFNSYNCVGCHANGGGGMGPPLMDAKWIYGSRPDQIFGSIAQGRPNGMPAFGGRVPDDQIWQLVAYVQAMGGHVPVDARPGRSDSMHVAEPEGLREEEPTVGQAAESP